MTEKYMMRLVLFIGVVIALVGGVWAYFDYQKMVIRQEQETRRTEERSQFWQKLVPWGEDEDDAT